MQRQDIPAAMFAIHRVDSHGRRLALRLEGRRSQAGQFSCPQARVSGQKIEHGPSLSDQSALGRTVPRCFDQYSRASSSEMIRRWRGRSLQVACCSDDQETRLRKLRLLSIGTYYRIRCVTPPWRRGATSVLIGRIEEADAQCVRSARHTVPRALTSETGLCPKWLRQVRRAILDVSVESFQTRSQIILARMSGRGTEQLDLAVPSDERSGLACATLARSSCAFCTPPFALTLDQSPNFMDNPSRWSVATGTGRFKRHAICGALASAMVGEPTSFRIQLHPSM